MMERRRRASFASFSIHLMGLFSYVLGRMEKLTELNGCDDVDDDDDGDDE